jgi:hypothetical protein
MDVYKTSRDNQRHVGSCWRENSLILKANKLGNYASLSAWVFVKIGYENGCVVVSCLMAHIFFMWRMDPLMEYGLSYVSDFELARKLWL